MCAPEPRATGGGGLTRQQVWAFREARYWKRKIRIRSLHQGETGKKKKGKKRKPGNCGCGFHPERGTTEEEIEVRSSRRKLKRGASTE